MSKLLKHITNKYKYYQVTNKKKPCLTINSNFELSSNLKDPLSLELTDKKNFSYNSYLYLSKKYSSSNFNSNSVKKLAVEWSIESGI